MRVSNRPPEIDTIARRIGAEFREMPGMRLTGAQIRRMCSLNGSAALEALRDGGEIVRDVSGRYTANVAEPTRLGKFSFVERPAPDMLI